MKKTSILLLFLQLFTGVCFCGETEIGKVDAVDNYGNRRILTVNYCSKLPGGDDEGDGFIIYCNKDHSGSNDDDAPFIGYGFCVEESDARNMTAVFEKFTGWVKTVKEKSMKNVQKEILPDVEKQFSEYTALSKYPEPMFMKCFLFVDKPGTCSLILYTNTYSMAQDGIEGNYYFLSEQGASLLTSYVSGTMLEKMRTLQKSKNADIDALR
ncbi:MAG: hypothetical protein M0P01_05015 [Treponema sp.]|nr:hypothetical protein [Treponema sp.]